VLEQNFQFDLVSQEKLLSRYIDRQVSVEQQSGDGIKVVDGTLVSSNDGLVIRSADGQIHALREWSNMRFGELPGGLITRPTLEWDVMSGKGGTQKARVSYQTGGITWWADYNLIFTEGADANSGFVDVGAWVSLLNQSGARYQEAKLKLIAGDVHRAQPPPQVLRKEIYEMSAVADAAAPGFEEKAFFEYHLYTLGRPATIPNNSTKQIELFDSATRVPAKKQLVYYGADFGGYYGQPMMGIIEIWIQSYGPFIRLDRLLVGETFVRRPQDQTPGEMTVSKIRVKGESFFNRDLRILIQPLLFFA